MQDQIYNINIEMSVLSSLIFEPTLLQKYNNKISFDSFYLPLNQKIFKVMLDLHKEQRPIDEMLIREKIGLENEEALLHILTYNPIVNLDSYIEILNDYSIKRAVNNLILNVGKDINNNKSGTELQARIGHLSEEFANKYKTEIFEIDNITNIQDKETEFICSSWLPIPKRTVSIITAPGGTGKSWLVLQFAMRVIKNKEASKAFLWLSEDPKEITKNRFNKIYKEILSYNDDWIKERIDISDSPTIQFLYEDQRKVEVSQHFYTFKAMLDKYDLIILDPLIAFYGTDENNNSQARRFMQLFTHWANKENKTLIFIHHSTKNTTQSRGASAFVDAVRIVYELDKIKNKNGDVIDTNKREIKLTKDNYGAGRLLDELSFQRVLFPRKDPKIVVETTLYKETIFGDANYVHNDF